MITVKNPWFRKDGPYSAKTYELKGEPVFTYRGVSVYHPVSSWLYVLGDTAITERAGFNKDKAPSIIDSILDGEVPSSDNVVTHLRAYGFKGLSYDEYSQAYAKGEMA